jgi:hypothetical protein
MVFKSFFPAGDAWIHGGQHIIHYSQIRKKWMWIPLIISHWHIIAAIPSLTNTVFSLIFWRLQIWLTLHGDPLLSSCTRRLIAQHWPCHKQTNNTPISEVAAAVDLIRRNSSNNEWQRWMTTYTTTQPHDLHTVAQPLSTANNTEKF